MVMIYQRVQRTHWQHIGILKVISMSISPPALFLLASHFDSLRSQDSAKPNPNPFTPLNTRTSFPTNNNVMMQFTNTILSLSALLFLAAAHPVENVTATSGGIISTSTVATPAETLVNVDLDADLALIELGLEVEVLKKNGVLEIEVEIEIGPLEIELELDIPLPKIPAPKDLAFLHRAATPQRVAKDEKNENTTTDVPGAGAPDHAAIVSRMMEEITCSLPHTRLAPTAGETFREYFALLNEGTYSIPAFRHIVWKIGKDRFRVENWTGKKLEGLKYADNEFAAQQFGLVCPDNCKGKGCWGKDEVAGGKIKNKIYTV